MTNQTVDGLLSRKAMAMRLSTSTKSLDRLRKRGLINWLRVGGKVMFRESELERFLASATNR